MRHKRNFQPGASEALEDRSVPSTAGGLTILVAPAVGAFETLPNTHKQDTPTPSLGGVLKTDIKAIRGAFQTFSHAYESALNSTLLPTGNRLAFDAKVKIALSGLNFQISKTLGNLPASVSSNLAATVQKDLLAGSQPTKLDLQSRLAALATPTRAKAVSPWLFRLGSTLNITFAESEVIGQVNRAVIAYNSNR